MVWPRTFIKIWQWLTGQMNRFSLVWFMMILNFNFLKLKLVLFLVANKINSTLFDTINKQRNNDNGNFGQRSVFYLNIVSLFDLMIMGKKRKEVINSFSFSHWKWIQELRRCLMVMLCGHVITICNSESTNFEWTE